MSTRGVPQTIEERGGQDHGERLGRGERLRNGESLRDGRRLETHDMLRMTFVSAAACCSLNNYGYGVLRGGCWIRTGLSGAYFTCLLVHSLYYSAPIDSHEMGMRMRMSDTNGEFERGDGEVSEEPADWPSLQGLGCPEKGGESWLLDVKMVRESCISMNGCGYFGCFKMLQSV